VFVAVTAVSEYELLVLSYIVPSVPDAVVKVGLVLKLNAAAPIADKPDGLITLISNGSFASDAIAVVMTNESELADINVVVAALSKVPVLLIKETVAPLWKLEPETVMTSPADAKKVGEQLEYAGGDVMAFH
jgi:hypothetical protein